MRARLRLGPGQRVDLLGDRAPEQLVPGGMELDLVDPMAEAVMGAEDRRIAVRLLAEADGRGPAEPLAEPPEPRLAPGPALALQRFEERGVLLEEVGVLERRRLVLDRVRGEVGIEGAHGGSPGAGPSDARPSLAVGKGQSSAFDLAVVLTGRRASPTPRQPT